MKIYLDLCTIQRPLDDPSQLRIRVETEAILGVLAWVDAGEIELVSSVALAFETARNPYPIRRTFAEEILAKAKHIVTATTSVERRTRHLLALGIKPLDALHLASAVEAEVDFFCTCDDKFLRRATAVKTKQTRVVNPLELIKETEP